MSSKKKHILIVGPDFFGYAKAISQTFESLGYKSSFLDERIDLNDYKKVAIRLSIPLISKYIAFKQRSKIIRHIINRCIYPTASNFCDRLCLTTNGFNSS